MKETGRLLDRVKAAKKNTFSRNEMLRKYSKKEDLSV
jgi:hypothetical protein